MAGEFPYPYKGYRFKVEIDNVFVAGFSEVTGFDATIDVTEYREGDAKDNTVRKLPGLVKYSNITFKRGVVDAIEFFTWLNEINQGKITPERKSVIVRLFDDSNQDTPVAEWKLVRAFPCKYVGPDLKGASSDVAIESIEFAHEGLVRTALGSGGGE